MRTCSKLYTAIVFRIKFSPLTLAVNPLSLFVLILLILVTFFNSKAPNSCFHSLYEDFFSGDSHLPLSFKKLLKALRKFFNLITRAFYSSQRSFIKVRFMLKTLALRLADYPASANTDLSHPQRSKARGSALNGSLPS